jgi:hypothetical protein
MQSALENNSVYWQPNFHAVPRSLRLIPVSGRDAMEWTSLAVFSLDGPSTSSLLAKGVNLGMDVIQRELLMPLNVNPPVEQIIDCFAAATLNRRAKKLSTILYLIHEHPGSPIVHRGLRFVTASLWASYACLGKDDIEEQALSTSVRSVSRILWTKLGWAVA